MMMVSLFPKRRRRRRSKPKLFEVEFLYGKRESFLKKHKEREKEKRF